MRLHRFLKESNVDLHFDPFAEAEGPEPESELDDGEADAEEELSPKRRFERKVSILRALVGLLEPSGKITNPSKCLTDLRNREAKATTGFGIGVAMPHVRTPQAKGFAMGVAIVPAPGLDFDAVDEEPVRLFFPMVAPPYDDKYYRRVEQRLAEAFTDEDDTTVRDALLAAETEGEVILILRGLLD